MPHPRASEYNLPAGHKSAKLVYLNYIQRHQRRTMYNLLPVGENQPFDCSQIDVLNYGGLAGQAASEFAGESATPVWEEVYSDPANPFLANYIKGSCQYPQCK
jgi:hypothetical protein